MNPGPNLANHKNHSHFCSPFNKIPGNPDDYEAYLSAFAQKEKK